MEDFRPFMAKRTTLIWVRRKHLEEGRLGNFVKYSRLRSGRPSQSPTTVDVARFTEGTKVSSPHLREVEEPVKVDRGPTHGVRGYRGPMNRCGTQYNLYIIT